jgi:peptidoglycan hydrolase FlgJ
MDVKATVLNSLDQNNVSRVDSIASKASRESELGKVRQLSKDFEAVFLEQMLRTMRSSVQKSGLIDGGNAEEIYRSMLDGEYAKLMAAQGASGLSQMIERQLLQTMGVKSEASGVLAKNAGHKAYQEAGDVALRPEQKEVKIKAEKTQVHGSR